MSQTRQQKIFLSIFFLTPAILLSVFIFPVEAMPVYIQPVSWLLPFTCFVEIIRGLLLRGNTFPDLAGDYMILQGFALVFTWMGIIRFRK